MPAAFLAAVALAAAPGPPLQALLVRPSVPVDSDPRAEAEEVRAVQLGVPNPSRLPPAGPRRAVAEAFMAWHDRDWQRLTVWAADTPRRTDALLRRYLLGFVVGRTVLEGPRATVSADVVVHDTWRLRTARREVRLTLFRDHERGQWVVTRRTMLQAARGEDHG